MLYFQVLFYTGSLLLLSYHCSQLIPDIYWTGLVLGTSSQLAILLIYNSSLIHLKYFVFWPFTINPYCADVSFSFWKFSSRYCLVLVISRMSSAYAIHCFRRVVIFPLSSMKISLTFIKVCVTFHTQMNNIAVPILTHYSGRVTQICIFNTVKLGTSARSP